MGIDFLIIDDPYTCEKCKGIFKRARPDSVAIEEAKDKFPDIEHYPMSIICDDCHIEFMKWYNENFNDRTLN